MTQFGVRPNFSNPKFFPQGNIVPRERVPPFSVPPLSDSIRKIAAEVQAALDNPAYRPDRPRRTMREIALEVAAEHGVTLADLISHRRSVPVVLARHMAMWRCRNETTKSFPEIGRFFDCDHSTICHAINKIDALRRSQSPKAEGEG